MKTFLALIILFACACSNQSSENSGNQELQPPVVPAFSKGADISWVTEQEAAGHKFYNSKGEERDCFALMKELGLDAIRLRVWVDPSAHGNWCNKEDLIRKAKRAADLGQNIMVDFHYSDWWADPGQQHKPASWKGLELASLKKAFTNHTEEVLNALKKEGIYPAWVQIGNEIRPGMLWDEDAGLSAASYDVRACDVKDSGTSSTAVKYRKNWTNLAAFITLGYDAVKSIFPETKVIVHLDNGYDNSLFTWFFDELKKNGGSWDIIGMSLYPYWSRGEVSEDQIVDKCISNINALAARYDCDVMIVETGMECANDNGILASDAVLEAGRDRLSEIIRKSRDKTSGRCRGVLYCEPQCTP